jgi:hypothetical protein
MTLRIANTGPAFLGSSGPDLTRPGRLTGSRTLRAKEPISTAVGVKCRTHRVIDGFKQAELNPGKSFNRYGR